MTELEELRHALAEALRERDMLQHQLRGVNKAFEAAQTQGQANQRQAILELVEKNTDLADELRRTREQLVNTAAMARKLIRANELLVEAKRQLGGGLASPQAWQRLVVEIRDFLSGQDG